MYGKTSVMGGTALAFTGFSSAWFIVAAAVLIVGGMLLLRLGRRRAATR
jgi:hypothetical protein